MKIDGIGKITFWFTEEAVQAWNQPQLTGKPGRPQLYSDMAIETCLTIKEVFHVDLRKTEGFITSLIDLCKLHLRVPDYTTLSCRAKNMSIALKARKEKSEVTDVVIDSSGVKVYGEGEWKVRQHGKSKKRTWRKIHIVFDPKTGDIIAEKLTGNDMTDGDVLLDLLPRLALTIPRLFADGAYDKWKCYDALSDRRIEPVIPPQRNAKIHQHGNSLAPPLLRDEHLRRIREIGRRSWKKEIGYHIRSLAETGMYRLKVLFSDKVKSRSFNRQATEMAIRCKALNRMNLLGMPKSYVVA